jgi:hypothetical protein
MTDRPILFSAPMIRALVEGRKTMTRRLAFRDLKEPQTKQIHGGARTTFRVPTLWQKVKPGDRLWVRETCWIDRTVIPELGQRRAFFEGGYVQWEGGGHGDAPGLPSSHVGEIFNLNISLKRHNSIHMPRWASRLTLEVTATKIEKLNAISEEDAKAEGVDRPIVPHWSNRPFRSAFRALWIDLHGAESWDANPDVVVISFTVHKCNIDALSQNK